MKLILEVQDFVYSEILDAALYYENKQEGLGQKLYSNFENTLFETEKRPLTFQKTRNNYRHALLSRFPYLIIFRIYENKILVFKLIHSKKHPSKRYK